MSRRDMEVALNSRIDGLSPSAKLLWVATVRYRNSDSGSCYPSQDTLMADTGLSERTIRRLTKELVNLGVMDITTGYGNRYQKVSTHYHFKIFDGPAKVTHTFQDNYQGDDASSNASDYAQAMPQTFLIGHDDRPRTENCGLRDSRSVIEAALDVTDDISRAVMMTPKPLFCSSRSGPLLTVNGSNGQRSTVDRSLRETTHTGETPVPLKKTTATTSGEQSPDPSQQIDSRHLIGQGPIPDNLNWECISLTEDPDREFPLFECEALYLVNIWKKKSTKPVFKSDFLRLLRKGHPYFDIQTDIQWMFSESHWANESHNHKGGWDIAYSSDVGH